MSKKRERYSQNNRKKNQKQRSSDKDDVDSFKLKEIMQKGNFIKMKF